MSATVAIIGTPNVGKSTLFNRLAGGRDALVADVPGLTRDRRYGYVHLEEGGRFTLIDTAGLMDEPGGVEAAMEEQSWLAVMEADLTIMLVDARMGLTAADQRIAERLRRSGNPALLVVNKTDGLDAEAAMADFYRLGSARILPISATHGRGIRELLATIGALLPRRQEAVADASAGTLVAVVGRPNVGKSTLINGVLGESRLVVSDVAGTTRDSVYIPFQRNGKDYTLIDTAGIRRRSRVRPVGEKFSVVKALEAIDRTQVVVLIVDCSEDLVEQDLRLLGYVLEAGKALLLAVNKWDLSTPERAAAVKKTLDRRLGFVDYIDVLFISALRSSGIGALFKAIDEAARSARCRISTAEANRVLGRLTADHLPPLQGRHRIKLRYAHMGGTEPPTIVVHGNRVEALPATYRRYLENGFRKALHLRGVPLRVRFHDAENPYSGRTNELTPRQRQKRARLIRHKS